MQTKLKEELFINRGGKALTVIERQTILPYLSTNSHPRHQEALQNRFGEFAKVKFPIGPSTL